LGLLGLTSTNQVMSSSVLAHKDRRGLLPKGEVVRRGFIDNEAKEQ